VETNADQAPKIIEEQVVSPDYLEIRSPMVGTFYRSSSPEKPPYIKVGDSIQQGSVVCIIEAMKLFNEIESEITGRIVKVAVEDATPVEYDQVLFLVER
jgi:acetyl-CoA carboxylase biotin carboxyl carrier protein